MSTKPNAEEQADIQRRLAEKRQKEREEQAELERQQHQAEIAERDALARSELDVMLDPLKEPERRLVRMHAYIIASARQHSSPHDRQQRIDDECLKLARYVTTGKA